MTVYEKIKEFRLQLGLKQAEFADILGIHQRDVSKLENGSKKFIPNSYLEYFVKSGYDVNSLFNDKMPLQKIGLENNSMHEPRAKYLQVTDKMQENQLIPLYNIEATAGLVGLFEHYNENSPINHLSIPNLPKCDGAVFVTGDSMYPLLKSGDIVIFKMINNIEDGIFWGEMYLISLTVDDDEYVSVKYIQKSEKGDKYIKLVSQNTHHQARDVQKSRIRALAIVKASVRINAMN